MRTAEPFFFPGDRTGCLLVHGFTGTPKEMRWLGEYLASKGYTALGVRLAGHATRPEDMIRSRYRDWTASVEDGWHLLNGCTERIFIIGLSMGGILSLLFASQFPVAGVVALATPHHTPNDPRVPFLKPLSKIKRFFPKETANWFDETAHQQHASYPVEPVRAYAEARDLLAEMQTALPRVTAPALLIFSRHDQTVRPEDQHADLIYKELGSTDKQLIWIDGSSHVITEDIQRQAVFEATADFIARNS